MVLLSAKHYLKEGLTYSPKSASLLLRKLRRGESIFRKTTAAELGRILQKEGINFPAAQFYVVAENLDGLTVEQPTVS